MTPEIEDEAIPGTSGKFLLVAEEILDSPVSAC